MTDKEQIIRNIRNQLKRSQKFNLSPCVGVCVVEDGYCKGCYRTLTEIGRWRDMAVEDKMSVISQLDDRINKKGEP